MFRSPFDAMLTIKKAGCRVRPSRWSHPATRPTSLLLPRLPTGHQKNKFRRLSAAWSPRVWLASHPEPLFPCLQPGDIKGLRIFAGFPLRLGKYMPKNAGKTQQPNGQFWVNFGSTTGQRGESSLAKGSFDEVYPESFDRAQDRLCLEQTPHNPVISCFIPGVHSTAAGLRSCHESSPHSA
jgi:hypothetical protein